MDHPLVKPLVGSRSTFRHPLPCRGFADRRRMRALIEAHWRLNRSAVNPDTDVLALTLADDMGGALVEAEAGSECLTWRIPSRWHVRKGQLRRLDGTVLADFAANPLHLWTHSIGFCGRISREELFESHLVSDPNRPDEFVYHYRNGYRHGAREWGFSLPYRIVETMTDPQYEVEIDADLDDAGSLKVVDVFLPGELPDTVFVMAHTCHPALVSDGLACIAAARELYYHLKAQERRRYSWRFLFGPEYFAAATYLARAGADQVAHLRFGIYLDMLSNHEPLGMQVSMQGNSRMDHAARNVLTSHTSIFLDRPYRQLWGNDETFYNGPGFLIPTIGIGRGMSREYHYDTDDFDHYSDYQTDQAVWVLARIAETLESDYVPRACFRGPLYLSRYGLYVDPTQDAKGAANIERMLALLDGRRSCLDIATALEVDFFFVRDFCDRLVKLGLAERHDRAPRPEDQGTL